MVSSSRYVAFAVFLVCGFCVAGTLAQGYINQDGSYEQFDHDHPNRWVLKATNGHLTGGWGNPFCWYGCSIDVDAVATVDVDVEKNTGSIIVEFSHTDVDVSNETTLPPGSLMNLSGEFRIVYDTFEQVGSNKFMEGGVADNVMLHGNKAPVMPKVHGFLGTWGPAKMYHNGADLFPNNSMFGHTMLTQRVYNETYYVPLDCDNLNTPWNPMMATEATDPNNERGCVEKNHPMPQELQINFRTNGASNLGSSAVNPDSQPVWIHLVFHDIEDNSPRDPDTTSLSPAELAAIIVGAVAVVAVIAAAVMYWTRGAASAATRV